MNGFETITIVGGYIILFSILFSLTKNIPYNWFLPTLEISNGLLWVKQQSFLFNSAYILVLALTSFGGLCAIMQTYSMIQNTGIRIFPYIIQKLITAVVTSLLAFIYITYIRQ